MKDFKVDNEPKITTGFSAPNHYFDTFSDKVLAQLSHETPKVIPLFTVAKKWYYALAAIIVLTISVLYLKNDSIKEQQPDYAAIENYISYQSTISQDEIVNFLDQEDLETIKIELKLKD